MIDVLRQKLKQKGVEVMIRGRTWNLAAGGCGIERITHGMAWHHSIYFFREKTKVGGSRMRFFTLSILEIP